MIRSINNAEEENVLDGKVALVIGGAGYLGSEISKIFLKQGALVLIASRNIEVKNLFKEEISDDVLKEKLRVYQVDITSDLSVSNLTDKILSDYPQGIDILVNSGWSGKKNSLDSISMEDWIYDIEVCLTGVFRTIKAFLPQLRSNKGVILNIASMYGHVAPDYRIYDGDKYVNPPSYGAAKAGVIQLTKYLASFLAPDGIRVNCISPGPFPFPSTQVENPKFIERLGSKNPMGRIGRPHEIAGASLLLCSELGSYITGQNLCIDGGWSVW